MTIEKRVEGFELLGKILRNYSESGTGNIGPDNFDIQAFPILENAVLQAEQENPWFTRANIIIALKNIAAMLDRKKIERFVERYEEKLNSLQPVRTVAVVMAGNIPLVGFHDLFCIMMTRHQFLGKRSKDDSRLLPAITEILTGINPAYGERIRFTDSRIDNFHAVIATGSNNTYRYFEYYFGKYPHILRKNRNGVAVLTGRETKRELAGLADDIFTYFGKGCRSVSKLYLPKGYPVQSLEEAFSTYRFLGDHNKYSNNCSYYKAICMIDKKQFVDFGHLLLVEDGRFETPVSIVHYEFYDDLPLLVGILNAHQEHIQCIVSHDKSIPGAIIPGSAQKPELPDFADGVDTMDFLLCL